MDKQERENLRRRCEKAIANPKKMCDGQSLAVKEVFCTDLLALLDHIDALERGVDSDGFITIPVRAEWLARQEHPKDWACKECCPDSEIIVDGFQCYRHQAKAALTKTEGN